MKINHVLPATLILDSSRIEDGLYHWSDVEEENSGWNNFNHFCYFKDEEILWSIDYSGEIKLFFIRKEMQNRQVSLDEFLDFISINATKETFNWLMFETDFLIKKEL
jgi:hypothetical protein